MGVKKLDIKLNNTLKSYLPGQTLVGIVTLLVDSPCKSKGLCLRFYGAAKAYWVERRGNTKYIYKIREPYFDGNVYLFGGASVPDVELPAGQKTYPFIFKLPEKLPASYRGGVGKVEYFIECRLHRPWVPDVTNKLTIYIKPVLDLRPISILLQFPRRTEEEGTVCCCCCASGPVTLTMTSDKGGYVPRELISFSAKVVNKSRANLTAHIALKQIVDIRARGGHSHEIVVIVKNKLGEIAAGQTGQWPQKISVPELPPTSMPNCALINIKYHLCLSAKTFGGNFQAVSEIFIGSIPVENTFQQHMREHSRPFPQNRTTPPPSRPAERFPTQTTINPHEPEPRMATGVIPLPYEPLHQSKQIGTRMSEEANDDRDDVRCILESNELPVATGVIPLPYEPLQQNQPHDQNENRTTQDADNREGDVRCILEADEPIDMADTIQLLRPET